MVQKVFDGSQNAAVLFVQTNCEGLRINARCVIVLSALMVDEKHVQTLVRKLMVNYLCRLIVRV